MNDENDGKTFSKINLVASACTFQLTDLPFTYISLKQEGGSVRVISSPSLDPRVKRWRLCPQPGPGSDIVFIFQAE